MVGEMHVRLRRNRRCRATQSRMLSRAIAEAEPRNRRCRDTKPQMLGCDIPRGYRRGEFSAGIGMHRSWVVLLCGFYFPLELLDYLQQCQSVVNKASWLRSAKCDSERLDGSVAWWPSVLAQWLSGLAQWLSQCCDLVLQRVCAMMHSCDVS